MKTRISFAGTEPQDLRTISLPGHGPEDVVIDCYGNLVTGLADGRIVRTDPDKGTTEVITAVRGRPLGLEALPDGRLLICDSPNGLLEFDESNSRLRTLIDCIDGEALPFCSNVAAGPDGTLYLSVSTMRYTIMDYRRDIIEHVPTGRLYRIAPGKQPELLLNDLMFANGVALAPDQSFVLVAETGACRIRRYWLSGARASSSEVFCLLPGFPDNMSVGTDGLFWVALPSKRNKVVDAIHCLPRALRRIVARLPDAPNSDAPSVSWVVALDCAARTVHTLKWSDETSIAVTGVCRREARLFLSSIYNNTIISVSTSTLSGAS
jgi:sugar lactone lactonase YvrE